jgi:hypothetical protein
MAEILSSPDAITLDTPLRLSVAARLAYPDGSMTVSGLRREAARGRHSTFSSLNNSVREQWRAIGLTSAERSIQDLAQAAGCERQADECVRLIDVPVLINGENRLLDRATGIISRSASAAILQKIVDGVAQQHGSVFRRHVLNIIKAGGKLNAKDKIKQLTDAVRARGDGNLARDVAETFGVAYLAGCFAIRCRLVLWTDHDLLNALSTVYSGARKMLPDDGVLLRSGLRTLRGTLRKLRKVAVHSGQKIDFEAVEGCCKSTRSALNATVFAIDGSFIIARQGRALSPKSAPTLFLPNWQRSRKN